MTNTQSTALLALIVLALAIIWISYRIGRRDGLEKRITTQHDLQSANDAKANRELFAVKLASATKIEDLQREIARHKQNITLSLKVGTEDLQTLYRLAAALKLAADTYTRLRADLKAAETHKAVQDCLALAERIKATKRTPAEDAA